MKVEVPEAEVEGTEAAEAVKVEVPEAGVEGTEAAEAVEASKRTETTNAVVTAAKTVAEGHEGGGARCG